MMKRFFSIGLILSFFIVFAGCRGEKGRVLSDEAKTVITFDLSQKAVGIFSVDMLEEPTLLNLASDDIMIGNVAQVVRHKDRVYLLSDDAGRNSITLVNMQGDCLKQIQRTGRGPLEYLGLKVMFVDQEKELLAAYSRQNQKIIYFDLEGDVKTEVEMPKKFGYVWSTAFGYAGDMTNYGEDKERRDNLWLMNQDFVLQESFFEIPMSWESKSSQFMPFSSYGEQTHYTRLLDNNIYSIEKDRLTVPYSFDFGKNNWPDPQAGYDQWRQIIQESPGYYVDRFDCFQETKRYVILQFLHKGQVCLGVYDKDSGKSTVCGLEAYTGKYFIPFGKIVSIDSNAIYTIIDASGVKRLRDGKDDYNDFEAEYPEQIRRLREDFLEIDPMGNPFLAIYRFK